MAIATQMSVEEYLRTSFDPDCEYVDGEVLERNEGEKDHSKVQKRLIVLFAKLRRSVGRFLAPGMAIQSDRPPLSSARLLHRRRT